MKINEAARLAGVTERTMRYYDRIGLLHPSRVTPAGYRIYDDAALRRLQQILFFRELGFPLKQIREMMESPGYDTMEALARHKQLLIAQRDRLNGLIALAERTLKGETEMSFAEFDRGDIERARQAYAQEAKRRWGDTPAYAQGEKKTADYDGDRWTQIEADAQDIFRRFAALRANGPADERVQALVKRWQAHITANYYECTKEILAGLGRMYTADERFARELDRYGEGTARLMADAIAAYGAQEP